MKHIFLTLVAYSALAAGLFAQDRSDKTPVTYEEIYDEPYSVNKLFVGFQPLYGELFVGNVNAGFGVEAVYYHEDKLDFRAHFRKTYTQQFFDYSRQLAVTRGDNENRAEVFNYFEIGATYHVKDFEESSKTRMVLFKNSYRGDRWASRVPLHADVPCKVRKIYGVRVGGILWDSSTDINRALKAQDLTHGELVVAGSDKAIPMQEFDQYGLQEDVDLFSNIYAKGFYLGGSMSWIRNVAVNFDKFEEGVDDLMFTAYADVLYSPSIVVDDIVYSPKDESGNRIVSETNTYSTSPIRIQNFGFRVGMDGRFNRTLGWAYGAEVGYRPGIEGRMFYAMFKISFPVYSSNLDYSVESFGK